MIFIYNKRPIRFFINQCRRELLLNTRQRRGLLFSSLFFCMMMVFFPLTVTSDIKILREVAPGLLWTTMLLALLLASERLFQQDYDDGVIEQWLVSGIPLSILVTAKVSVHWLLNLCSILIFCPIIGILFNFSFYEMFILVISLILGTPTIIFLSALVSAFCSGVQQKGALVALVLLPLVVPVMIFGSGAVSAVMQGMPANAYLAILTACSLLAITFLPKAIAVVIQISLTD